MWKVNTDELKSKLAHFNSPCENTAGEGSRERFRGINPTSKPARLTYKYTYPTFIKLNFPGYHHTCSLKSRPCACSARVASWTLNHQSPPGNLDSLASVCLFGKKNFWAIVRSHSSFPRSSLNVLFYHRVNIWLAEAQWQRSSGRQIIRSFSS